MKKILKAIYCISIVILLCVPSVLMINNKNKTPSSEKRSLSNFPKLKNEEGVLNLKFPSEFDLFFSENFKFRENLITINNFITNKVFITSAEDDVILGENDWLFYAPTLNDYLARDTLSEDEINKIVTTLKLMNENITSKGNKFIFTVAPNKNSIYNEFMPKRYVKISDENNLKMLTDKLQKSDIVYCDLLKLFNENSEILYHKFDSHWTYKGAFFAYKELLNSMQVKNDKFENIVFSSNKNWDGDLSTMLYPSLKIKDYQADYEYNFSYSYASRFKDFDDIEIKTLNENADNQTFVMYRDSFGRALIPYLAETFYDTTFLRSNLYKIDEVSNSNFVVLEIVERNIPNLISKTPFMSAPQREIDNSNFTNKINNEDVTIFEKNAGDYIQLYGTINSKFLNSNKEIIINLKNENTNLYFESFPILETDLIENPQDEHEGYSLYINKSQLPIGNYEVSVFLKNDSENYYTDPIHNINISE